MDALKADPKNPENYYNLGVVMQKSGNHEEAVEVFSMYIAIPGIKPDQLADAYNNRGNSHRLMKRPGAAHADLTKAIELSPTVARFYSNRGNANADLGKFDEALADYGHAIKLDPKDATAFSGRGHIFTAQSKTSDAIREFTKAIEADGNYHEAYYNRGVMYSSQKKFGEAILDYDRYILLIANNPSYLADGYMNRGIAHAYSGSPQKAIDDFSKVIELEPSNDKGYRARAMIYREMKKEALAEADERKAASLKRADAN